ncbi:amidase family protein [Rothia nasimurium]|uniref:amidase family protein n=1 Tax=Rothia nasimurium TaxID=85336 RepID=UPI001EED59DF|nr:amidase family protein [Rothia nasimurium]
MVTWHTLDAHDWRQAVAASSAAEGLDAALTRITQLNPTLNAFTLLLEDEARAAAQALDRLTPGERGPLHGVPVVIKDENDVAGTATSFGTAANTSPKAEDSLTVQRLRQAGALILGKTTMPAFGAFPVTESDAFGITRNPVDPRFTPGGSSGGSAVAVASGMVPLALGGDGGGSIRIPADRCGVVGFKPARGTVPTAPYGHLWHDLGTAGPITRSVRDAELMYRVLAGLPQPAPWADAVPVRPLKIAVSARPASPLAKLHPDHRKALWAAAQALRAAGHTVTWVDERVPDPTAAFTVQFFAGLIDEIQALEAPEKIEPLHRHTAQLGFWATGPVLTRAKAAGAVISERLDTTYFTDHDLLLTPTTASRPAPVGTLGRGLVGRHGAFLKAMAVAVPSVAYTLIWNVAGNPALSIPAGRARDGLPTSVQLVAPRRPGAEDLLFEAGQHLERHLR